MTDIINKRSWSQEHENERFPRLLCLFPLNVASNPTTRRNGSRVNSFFLPYHQNWKKENLKMKWPRLWTWSSVGTRCINWVSKMTHSCQHCSLNTWILNDFFLKGQRKNELLPIKCNYGILLPYLPFFTCPKFSMSYIQKWWKPFEKIHAPQCPQPHCLQYPSAHQQMTGSRKCTHTHTGI